MRSWLVGHDAARQIETARVHHARGGCGCRRIDHIGTSGNGTTAGKTAARRHVVARRVRCDSHLRRFPPGTSRSRLRRRQNHFPRVSVERQVTSIASCGAQIPVIFRSTSQPYSTSWSICEPHAPSVSRSRLILFCRQRGDRIGSGSIPAACQPRAIAVLTRWRHDGRSGRAIRRPFPASGRGRCRTS
jgi:hypothetical protein